MATISEIKSNNNTLIRVKTTAKSITKANVADQLDATVDFTAQEINTVNSALSNKVDKVAGKSLIADTEIIRLAGVSNVDVSGKEDISNKSTNVATDGASDTKYPSVKAVKTYVDSNILTKVLKITITQTDISTLHTTGKLLFRNLDESVKVIPLSYYFKRTPGTPYTSGSNIMYIFDEDTNIFQTINKPFLANTGGYLIVNASANFHSNIIDNNVDLILKSDEEFTGGTEGFDVYLVYNEITL